jgi:putative addiction module component (TIGR02574 family)
MIQTLGTLEDVKKLSLSEKIFIVEEIWDSIEHENEYQETSEIEKAELQRRDASYLSNPSQGRDWEEIKKEYWDRKQK